ICHSEEGVPRQQAEYKRLRRYRSTPPTPPTQTTGGPGGAPGCPRHTTARRTKTRCAATSPSGNWKPRISTPPSLSWPTSAPGSRSKAATSSTRYSDIAALMWRWANHSTPGMRRRTPPRHSVIGHRAALRRCSHPVQPRGWVQVRPLPPPDRGPGQRSQQRPDYEYRDGDHEHLVEAAGGVDREPG